MSGVSEDLTAFHRDPTAPITTTHPATRFLAAACLTYGDDDPGARTGASQWLAATRRDPWVAAALGDATALEPLLDAQPQIASTDGGPWRWPPLLYLAYSRVPQQDPVAAARLLLDAGGDPDAGFLWKGLPTPFTALTGCFGHGEGGPGRQPPHPQAERLASLLLGYGADPNDAQTLYNRMFSRDDSHLRLLLEHGLGHGDGGVWHRRVGPGLESPEEMVRRQVDWAREHGFTDRLRLLAEHGFTDGTDGRSPWTRRRPTLPQDLIGTPAAVVEAVATGIDLDRLVDGRTVLHQAAWIGDVELVEALLAAGANPDLVDADHHTTPLAWAEWAWADATAAVLRPVTSRGR